MKGKVAHLDERSGIYEIDPQIARKLVDEAGNKRPLSERSVAKYLGRMQNGRWKMNGQPLLMSTGDCLLDGQHRLEAVARLGKAVRFLVIYGDFDYKSMDQGKARDGADVLHIMMETKYRNTMRAVIRLVLAHDVALSKERSYWTVVKGGSRIDIDNAEYPLFAKRNPDLGHIVELAEAMRSDLLPPSPIAAAWFLVARRYGRPMADAWFQLLITGANLEEDDVRLALRRRLASDKGNGKRPMGYETFPMLCKAWAQRDQQVKVFRLNPGESVPLIR